MDKQGIKNLAVEQLKETGSEIPVRIVDIAKKNNLSVYEVDLSDIGGTNLSGALKADNGKWVILVNISESIERKRFTIAHELGHFLLHAGESFVDDFSSSEVFYRANAVDNAGKEKEANFFAANILMPEESVRKSWELYGDTEKMAEVFMVSELSMVYRLKNLSLLSD